MRIFSCSNWGLKFLGVINEFWRKEGHEVHYEIGYNPKRHEWADLCFVDVCDHNAQVASQNKFPNSNLVIRAIDIECWARQPGGVNWENVDVLIFGARHIEELVRSYMGDRLPETLKIVHIPFGVDLDRWSWRERNSERGHNIAFVAHQWAAKGMPLLLQVMSLLPGYKLHMLGTKSGGDTWLHPYVDQMINELAIDTTYIDSVPSVDEWLEDKDYLIVSSQKEAFSYAAAEAAAKGIKPLIHNFWGARGVWPGEWIWNTIGECVDMVRSNDYNSLSYRNFIEESYSIDLVMERINEVCEIS